MNTILKVVLIALLIALGVYASMKDYGYISLLCGIFGGSLFTLLYGSIKEKRKNNGL